jgi:hypothetical protein
MTSSLVQWISDPLREVFVCTSVDIVIGSSFWFPDSNEASFWHETAAAAAMAAIMIRLIFIIVSLD